LRVSTEKRRNTPMRRTEVGDTLPTDDLLENRFHVRETRAVIDDWQPLALGHSVDLFLRASLNMRMKGKGNEDVLRDRLGLPR